MSVTPGCEMRGCKADGTCLCGVCDGHFCEPHSDHGPIGDAPHAGRSTPDDDVTLRHHVLFIAGEITGRALTVPLSALIEASDGSQLTATNRALLQAVIQFRRHVDRILSR